MIFSLLGLIPVILIYKGITIDLEFKRQLKIILLLTVGVSIGLIYLFGYIAGFPGFLLFYPSHWMSFTIMMLVYCIFQFLISLLFMKYREKIVIVSLFLFIGVTVFSIFNGFLLLNKHEITLYSPKLPANFTEFKIVQVSDLHLGGLITPKQMHNAIQKINETNADLVVITGDLVEGVNKPETWKPFIPILREIQSKYGTVAVCGNHDLVRGTDAFLDFTKESHIRVLNNESILLDNCIRIVGINDPSGIEYKIGGMDFDKAFRSVDKKEMTILLSHRPTYFEMAKKYGTDLMLSGHTHGGQIPFIDLLSRFTVDYLYGLYQEGSAYMYVSSGMSTTDSPIRLFTMNEIVVIKIKPTFS